jgi:shikimate dehydrogenase
MAVTSGRFPQGKVLLGLIGAGIQQSLTPAMHEEEARHHGLKLHYQLIDLERTGSTVEELPLLLRAARTMGFAGLNITFPCKQAVIPLLHEMSDEARQMGAVNTVVAQDGRWVGHNTDGAGWSWGFRHALPDASLDSVVLLGAGGAGSAIGHAVMRLGARNLRIVDQDAGRAQNLAASLNAIYGTRASAIADIERAMEGASGLIHATPTGMDKIPGMAVPARLLRPPLWVSEVIYFPIETELLKTARAQGCATVDGGTMAVGQAVGAFELFTGFAADAQRMEAHFRSLLPKG